MKFTHFKHILALPTYGLTCPGFEWWAFKKWKMEPGHSVCTRVFYIIILSRHISFAFSYYHEQTLPMPIKTNPQYAHISVSNPFSRNFSIFIV